MLKRKNRIYHLPYGVINSLIWECIAISEKGKYLSDYRVKKLLNQFEQEFKNKGEYVE